MIEFFKSLEQLPLSIWVRESGSIWAFPTVLLLHTLGMSMVAGSNAMMDLALLGFWPKAPLKPLEKLYPLMWVGLIVNAITGTLLLLQDAATKLINPDFYIKMAFVFAGVVILYKMRSRVFGDPRLDQEPVSKNAKMLAWASLICWFSAITAGRLLAYVGPVSGLSGISNH
jgi:hypothetical protein